MAKMSKKQMKRPTSRLLAVTRSVEYRMVRISCPARRNPNWCTSAALRAAAPGAARSARPRQQCRLKGRGALRRGTLLELSGLSVCVARELAQEVGGPACVTAGRRVAGTPMHAMQGVMLRRSAGGRVARVTGDRRGRRGARPAPCAVSKPVRSTTARQPPSGVRTRAPLSPVCCSTLVPLNSTWFLCRLMLRRWCGSTCARAEAIPS